MSRLRYVLVCGWLVGIGSVVSAKTESARIDSLVWRAVVTGNKVAVTKHVRVTILSAAGSDMATVSGWESDLVKLRSLDARMITAAGKVTQKRSKGDMVKSCGFGQSFQIYADYCSYYTEFTSAEYPFTVEYDCAYEYQSLFFLTGIPLQYDAPVSVALVSVQHPQDLRIRWKVYGLAGRADTTLTGDQVNLAWTFSDVPADSELTYVLPEDVEPPRLVLAADRFELDNYVLDGCSWKNLGLFHKQLSEGRYLPEAAAPRRATATREEADAIYTSVISATRYVSVDIRLSGWRTEPAGVVQAKAYGDCKGLSTLLVSRLRGAGIEAYPALVLTNDAGRADPEFPSEQFNHAIACAIVEGDTLWMDATCSFCPPGDLPPGDEGALALVVTDTGGVLVEVPWSRAEDNVITRASTVTFRDSGGADVKVTATVSGNFALNLRGVFAHLKDDRKNTWVQEWFLGANKRFALDSFELDNLASITKPVVIRAGFTSTKPFDVVQRTRYYLPFINTSRDAFDDLKLHERTKGVNWSYPRSLYDSITIRGVGVSQADSLVLPLGDSVTFGGWRSVTEFSRQDSGVTAELNQVYTTTRVLPPQFAELSTYIAARRKLLDRPVKLIDTKQLGIK